MLGNNHGNGRHVNTVFECVFITGLKCGNINCNRIIVIDGRHQVICNAVGCRHHFLGTGIAVYVLDAFGNTLFYAVGEHNLGTVVRAVFFDVFFRLRGNLFFCFVCGIFFPQLDINSHDSELDHGINHVLVQFCAAGNQITPEPVHNGMVQFHSRLQLSCSHVLTFHQISLHVLIFYNVFPRVTTVSAKIFQAFPLSGKLVLWYSLEEPKMSGILA